MRRLATAWVIPGTRLVGEEDRLFFSVPTSQIVGLRESLHILAKETLETRWSRTAKSASQLIQGLRKAGLQPFVQNPKIRLDTTTLFNLPNKISVNDLQDYLLNRHRVDVGDGYYRSSSRALRIGTFGPNATPVKVDFIIQVVSKALDVLMAQPPTRGIPLQIRHN